MVVSNTSPLNYAVLIGEVETLRQLYGRVTIPRAVYAELRHEGAPEAVREWMASRPDWVEVREVRGPFDAALMSLDPGEREAIALAQQLQATALIMDERDGRKEAQKRNLLLTGTLGVLRDTGAKGLCDFDAALDRLRNLDKPEYHLSSEVEQQVRRQYQELVRAREALEP